MAQLLLLLTEFSSVHIPLSGIHYIPFCVVWANSAASVKLLIHVSHREWYYEYRDATVI